MEPITRAVALSAARRARPGGESVGLSCGTLPHVSKPTGEDWLDVAGAGEGTRQRRRSTRQEGLMGTVQDVICRAVMAVLALYLVGIVFSLVLFAVALACMLYV